MACPPHRLVVAAVTGALAALAGGCGDDTAGAPRGDALAGARVATSVEPACSQCHTLAGAGWEGTIGPNLDRLRPGFGRTLEAITTGPGTMPSFDGQLTAREARDLAAHVSDTAVEGG